MVDFQIIGAIADEEVIAVGTAIRELPRLISFYGEGRWRKLKGNALIRLNDGRFLFAELHWYKAHGIGRKEMKVKYILDNNPEDKGM